MIDNYDSFTYNVVQYLREMAAEVEVARNDAIDIAGIRAIAPQAIVISPGPGRPESAGVSMGAIKEFAGKIPVFGICLGHQSIAQAFGGKVVPAKRLMHGKVSEVSCDGEGLLKGLGNGTFKAMRYHSLAVEEASLPSCLKVTARSEDGETMGIRHVEFPLEGIQFHPESIITTVGKRIIRNFIKQTASTQGN